MSTHVWVDVECPNFFLVRHFSILGLCIFSNFWGYLRYFFFQLFGHFISTHVWVDVGCPNVFFGPIFFYFGTLYFFNFLRMFKNIFFSCLGISCLLTFEWMWNALIFFWSDIFLFWDFVFFQISGDSACQCFSWCLTFVMITVDRVIHTTEKSVDQTFRKFVGMIECM